MLIEKVPNADLQLNFASPFYYIHCRITTALNYLLRQAFVATVDKGGYIISIQHYIPPPHSGRKCSFSGNYSHIFQKCPFLLTRTPAKVPKVTNNSLRPNWHPSAPPGTIIGTINGTILALFKVLVLRLSRDFGSKSIFESESHLE